MKRSRGRPPKEPEQAKSSQLQVRVTEAEKAEFFDASERAGIPLSEWARNVLLRAARRKATA